MIHFALAHFPIALIMTGGLLLFAMIVTRRDGGGRTAAVIMMGAGALFAIPTVASGLWLASEHEHHAGGLLDTHRLLGLGTLGVSIAAIVFHLLRDRVTNADLIRNLLFPLAAVLVGATSFYGAEMAHGDEEHEHGHEHGSVDVDDHDADHDDHDDHDADHDDDHDHAEHSH